VSRIGTLAGGRQAPRHETLTRLRFGTAEAGAIAVSALCVVLALRATRDLGLASGEAIARTAHLGALWAGFDPSPLAFGLERPPLTTLLALPFAAFRALRVDAVAAALGTAVVGGGTVLAAAGIARRCGFARPARFVFVTAFALQPLLLFSSAVGLPEALYAALVLAAFGQFMQWLRIDSVGAVIGAGVAMAVAFLVRYDAVFVAAAMGAGFWWVARHRGPVSVRADSAQATLLAFATPVAFVIGFWALVAWFPYGHLNEFLRRASALTALGGDDPALVRRMAALRGHPLSVFTWVGGWSLALAPLSAVAVAALLAFGALWRDRAAVAFGGVLASVLAPPVLALLAGHAQPRVTHLFVAVVPLFAAVAYVEQRRSRGVPPTAIESRRRRQQLLLVAPLIVAALAQVAVLPHLPATDAPAPGFVGALIHERPAAAQADAAAVATWVEENASIGDVLVDMNRSAAVMVASGRYDRFRTAADPGNEATVYNPFGVVNYILVRRPVPGAATGPFERAHPGLYDNGAGFGALAFEAGAYRVYRVEREPTR
jgi:4-amino-4-deoxy-L-arabinose transferase-like glycosyltransferase